MGVALLLVAVAHDTDRAAPPPLTCKDRLGRTHCPDFPEQCLQQHHQPCAPCAPPKPRGLLACQPPHHTYPFCDTTRSVPDRIHDLIGRINTSAKPALLTARRAKALPELGVPGYSWGTNCVHSISDIASCVVDSHNVTVTVSRPSECSCSLNLSPFTAAAPAGSFSLTHMGL